MLKTYPSSKIIKYADFDLDKKILRIEDCGVSENNVKALMYALYSMNNHIRGLSLSYNKHFNDECLRQLVEVLPDL